MLKLKSNPLFAEFDQLGLLAGEYAIFGSGIMFAYGIRPLDELDDIDLVVNTKGWEKITKLGKSEKAETWPCEHVVLADGKIDVYNGWGPGKYDVDKLIESAVKVGGYSFVDIATTIGWKKEMGREKDFKHVAMMEAFLNKRRLK